MHTATHWRCVLILISLVGGIAVGSSAAADYLLVCEFASGPNPGNRILRYSASTGEFEGVVIDQSAGLKGPGSMLLHPIRGTLLVTSFLSNSVMEFDLTSGKRVSEFGSNELLRPIDIKIHPFRNTLLISGRDNHAILEFDLRTNAFLGNFIVGGPTLNAFEFDFDLNRETLLLANWQQFGGSLIEYDLHTGAPLRTITHHELVAPSGVLVNPHTGHILTDTNHAVLEFDAVSGNLIGTFASHRSLN